MKFRKSGEEFSSCHTARKIIKENELGGNTKKIYCVVFGTVINAIIYIKQLTDTWLQHFQFVILRTYFSVTGNKNNNSQFSTVSKARRTE